jgi:hypothetical protein
MKNVKKERVIRRARYDMTYDGSKQKIAARIGVAEDCLFPKRIKRDYVERTPWEIVRRIPYLAEDIVCTRLFDVLIMRRVCPEQKIHGHDDVRFRHGPDLLLL